MGTIHKKEAANPQLKQYPELKMVVIRGKVPGQVHSGCPLEQPKPPTGKMIA